MSDDAFSFSACEPLKVELLRMHYTSKHRLCTSTKALIREKSPNTPWNAALQKCNRNNFIVS